MGGGGEGVGGWRRVLNMGVRERDPTIEKQTILSKSIGGNCGSGFLRAYYILGNNGSTFSRTKKI